MYCFRHSCDGDLAKPLYEDYLACILESLGDKKMTKDKAKAKAKVDAVGEMSLEEVRAFVGEIEQTVADSKDAYLNSVIALNQILRLPNAEALLDEQLKEQMRALWVKLRSTGIKLNDPPILFGLPEGFGEEAQELVESEDVAELSEEVAELSKSNPAVEKPALDEGTAVDGGNLN